MCKVLKGSTQTLYSKTGLGFKINTVKPYGAKKNKLFLKSSAIKIYKSSQLSGLCERKANSNFKIMGSCQI